jgi:hypothetical protein
VLITTLSYLQNQKIKKSQQTTVSGIQKSKFKPCGFYKKSPPSSVIANEAQRNEAICLLLSTYHSGRIFSKKLAFLKPFTDTKWLSFFSFFLLK